MSLGTHFGTKPKSGARHISGHINSASSGSRPGPGPGKPAIDSRSFAVPEVDEEDQHSLSDSSSGSSYAGSAQEYASDFSAVEYLQEQLNNVFDEMKLDKAVAVQAQTSGVLNSKSKELLTTFKEAQERLTSFKKELAAGIKYASYTEKELESSSRRIASLTRRVKQAYPIEYQQAKEKFPEDDF